MAQSKRGKTQARRSGSGNGALPGWAWLVIGVAVTLLVVLAVPRLMTRNGDGFFRPRPNPDAAPQPVNEEAVVEDDMPAEAVPAKAAKGEAKPGNFDFYTLLPGKETPVSDAELAAREKAEQQQAKAEDKPAVDAAAPVTGTAMPLPAPVDDTMPATSAPSATAKADSVPAPAAKAEAVPTPSARYLLQAGAFQASAQAEELKAKIALLGVGARVETAQIRGSTVYRVRMGPYGSASDLAEAKRKLAAGGLSALAVKVSGAGG
ncbi:MAG: sporulation protein [Lysobacter sp.]|nr:MAG: sporulation protein [Lysobacter sp.]